MNEYQKSFCNLIVKDTIKLTVSKNAPVEYNPPKYCFGKPELHQFYMKKVYVFAPHAQFGGLKVICPKCSKDLICNGYSNNPVAREIEDINGLQYLIQAKYKCSNVQCTIQNILSMELLKNYDDWVQEQIPLILTNNKGYTKEFLLMILNDSTTGKTFEEIAKTIGTFRFNQYLSKKLLFISAKKYHNNNKSIFHVDINYEVIDDFSTMDDSSGYNESLHPHVDTLVILFKNYMNDYKEKMEKLQIIDEVNFYFFLFLYKCFINIYIL